jgi:hypothetical protein
MEVLAGLSCISAPAAASVVAMCVNANKLAQSLTSQNPTKKTQRPNLKPHNNAHTHPHKQTNTTQHRKKTGRRAKNATLFQQALDEQCCGNRNFGK